MVNLQKSSMKKAALIITIPLFIQGCKAQSDLKIKEVFLYKNGFSHIHKSGNLVLNDGKYQFVNENIPQATFGSIWFQSSKKIESVHSKWDTLPERVFQPSAEIMLLNSLGRNIKLHLESAGGMEIVQGKVINIYKPAPSGNAIIKNPAIADIETPGGLVTVFRNTLDKVIYASFGLEAGKITMEKIQPVLTVGFNSKEKTAELDLVYLEHSHPWSPSYRLKLIGDKKAVFTMNAEVSSGSNSFKNATLNLVDGSPEVYQGGILSKLCGGEGYINEYRQGKFNADIAAYKRAEEIESENAGDYYIYTIKNFSLQKNQTELLQIFQKDIAVSHSFECGLSDVTEYFQPGEQMTYPVFHVVEFVNPVKEPLTSAPVFVENPYSAGGDVLLGQPVLQAVATNGKAKVQVARNVNIPVTAMEFESNRIAGAYTTKADLNQLSFDLVQIEATAYVENQTKDEIVLKLVRNINGKALKSVPEWEIQNLPPVSGSVNKSLKATWNLKLKPGEKREIKYSYEYYLRMY